jgi:hypothetical protein
MEGGAMATVLVKSKRVELPLEVARKIIGKQMEILETEDGGVLLRPVPNLVDAAWGALKGCKLTAEEFLRQKQEEKELE